MSQRLLPKPKVFISAAELKPVLDNVVFFDVRASGAKGLTAHETCRPAATKSACLYIDYNTPIVRDVALMEKTGGRHHLPAYDKFLAWAQDQGIGRKPAVCFDDQCGGSNAARFWWMLDQIGCEVYILDGGIHAYVAEGLPVASGKNDTTRVDEPWSKEEKCPLSTSSNWKNVIKFDELVDNTTQYKILDARNMERFASLDRPQGTDGQAGHIFNSEPYPYMSNMTGPQGAPATRKKSDEELMILWKKMTAPISDEHPENVVMSCGSGVTACYNFAVQRHLGLPDPKLYIGSYSEWATLNREQVVKDQVEKQGYSISIAAGTNNIDGASVAKDDDEKLALTISEGVVDGEEKKFDNFSAVCKEYEGKDDNLIKALKMLKKNEKATVYTAGSKVYQVQC